MTTNLRPSGFTVSSAPKPDATVPGPDAALALLRDVAFRRSELYPPDVSHEVTRQQFRGEKPPRMHTFDYVLWQLFRRGGRETVRRIFNSWLEKYGFHAADVAPVPAVKTIPEELLEAHTAVSRLAADIDTFAPSGFDESERREIRRRGDKTIAEIRDVVGAVCR